MAQTIKRGAYTYPLGKCGNPKCKTPTTTALCDPCYEALKTRNAERRARKARREVGV